MAQCLRGEENRKNLSAKKRQAYNIVIDGELVTEALLLASSFNSCLCLVYTAVNGIKPDFTISDNFLQITDITISEEGVLSLPLNVDVKND